MNWLPFIIAYLIAPTLVIVVFYVFAVMLGITFVFSFAIGLALLACYMGFKTIRFIRQKRSSIHRANRQYLKKRLSYL